MYDEIVLHNVLQKYHFYFQFYNITNSALLIKKGDVIGQAIFQKYLVADEDSAEAVREGGFGSTTKE